MDNPAVKNNLTRRSRQSKDIHTGGRGTLRKAFLPLCFIALLLAVWFMPGSNINEDDTIISTLRIPNSPVFLMLERSGGTITSAWLRTPAGARRIDQLDGMVYAADSVIETKVDQDSQNDLLWRISFTNFEGTGVHLWIGLTTWNPTAFIAVSPYHYTRWDAIPAKLVVPKGTAIYVSPATPSYNKAGQFSGRQSYSFVYTIRMTPEGPAFVPIPDVYKQLALLLRAGIRGEFDPMKRLAYVRMLGEFNNLAEGKPPQAETMLNFPLTRTDTISWKH